MNKVEARAALDLALANEASSWRAFARTEMKHRDMACPAFLAAARVAVEKDVAATKAATDALVSSCEEETRARIVAWIAAAPARMEAQAAAGATSLHCMHDIGQLAAAAKLAEAIKNKSDLKDHQG